MERHPLTENIDEYLDHLNQFEPEPVKYSVVCSRCKRTIHHPATLRYIVKNAICRDCRKEVK